MKLPREFYGRDDVVGISRELLGKVLYTDVDGTITAAIVTETEAYAGVADRASHAHGGRRTRRTEPLFGPGGTAYVYLCYGIHHLFNVVVGDVDQPLAVLVRAGRPLVGMDTMLARRKKQRMSPTLLSGPGCLAQGLGITTELSGSSLVDGCIWLEDRDVSLPTQDIVTGPRVGVDYAGEDAALPYRFRIPDPGSVSPQRR